MKTKRVHAGEEILRIIKEKGMSKAQFARELGVQRQNIDKLIFQKHGIDSDLLCLISEILDCNLFRLFYDENEISVHEQNKRREIRAKITIEMGQEKQDRTLRFVFGENDVEIKTI